MLTWLFQVGISGLWLGVPATYGVKVGLKKLEFLDYRSACPSGAIGSVEVRATWLQ